MKKKTVDVLFLAPLNVLREVQAEALQLANLHGQRLDLLAEFLHRRIVGHKRWTARRALVLVGKELVDEDPRLVKGKGRADAVKLWRCRDVRLADFVLAMGTANRQKRAKYSESLP